MSEDLPLNEVLVGDCREVLDELPKESIDMVMFSPPYWGLRDYGEDAESVWGGDEDCEHEWEVKERKRKRHHRAGFGVRDEYKAGKDLKVDEETEVKSSFCRKCGAWRGQFGLEPDYRMYVEHLVEIGRKVKKVLKPSGSWYLNLGDTYAGSGHYEPHHKGYGEQKETVSTGMQTSQENMKDKCKMLIPYRVALALIDDGWICRNDIIWLKPNPMPSSVKDRLNTTTEKIFHFVKEKQYYYDLDAIREPHKESTKKRNNYPHSGGGPFAVQRERKPGEFMNEKGKNPGDVIKQTTQPFPEAHFAVYPPDLCEKPIKSSCPKKVCVECGKPYEREVERPSAPDDVFTNTSRTGNCKSMASGEGSGQKLQEWREKHPPKFKGWEKTCDCDTDETKSGVVLDPMCGAGSTLKKAEELGRNYIGIEINSEYANMAKRRVANSLNQKVPKKREVSEDCKELEAFE